MKQFDELFFMELSGMSLLENAGADLALRPPKDGFRLSVSELLQAGWISDGVATLAGAFVDCLAFRSKGKYLFKRDFVAFPHRLYCHSVGLEGRKQLHIGFDAYPKSPLSDRQWGVSVGLGFDLRMKDGISAECVREYEAFHEKVYCAPEIFDSTFGPMGGYAEGVNADELPMTAEKAWQSVPDILQHWLFFGKRLSLADIQELGSLDAFADECIRIFDLICDAGYFEVNTKLPWTALWRGSPLSFENFAAGEANMLARDAAVCVGGATARAGDNPLVIIGKGGLGKTHLLHAIASEYSRNNPEARIGYVHAERFVMHVVEAYQTNRVPELVNFYSSLDMLLLDDVECLADKDRSQEVLSCILGGLLDIGTPVIASCVTPLRLSGIDRRIISKLERGSQVQILPPEKELRLTILRGGNVFGELTVPDDVVVFISEFPISNVRELEGLCKRITAFARFYKRPITVQLVQEAVRDLLE